MVEADELKKSKGHLQKQLDERNEEIDRLRGNQNNTETKSSIPPNQVISNSNNTNTNNIIVNESNFKQDNTLQEKDFRCLYCGLFFNRGENGPCNRHSLGVCNNIFIKSNSLLV